MLTRRWSAPFLLALVAIVASVLAPAPAGAWTRLPQRIAGADRYQTAVDLSRAAFPDTASAVVVARGDSFADGLAAGPLAARAGGPVLLTLRDSLPASTAGELRRLQPTSVFVVGGTGVITAGVAEEIRQATGRSPRRLAGADRFETAAAVASLFPAGGPRVYVATGMAFPDALAGGAAAAIAGAPLVLVHPDGLPRSAAAALDRLRPSEIVVLGGASAVGPAVEQQLRALAPVRRLQGPDRYGTAAAVASDVGLTNEVILVTGESFADALAAATLAARRDAPLLLTTRTCAPQPTVDLLQRSGWPDVTGAGGTGVLSSRALALVPCTRVPDQQLHPGVGISTAILPGPSVARVITFDPRQGLTLRGTTATGRIGGRLPVSQINRRIGTPLVTVNGAFFAGGGEPVYPFAVDGRLIHAPGRTNDSFIGLDPARPGHLLVAKPALAMAVRPDDGSPEIPLHRINSGLPTSPDEVVMFTREQPATRTPDHPSCRAQLRDTGPVGIIEGNITSRPVVVETVRCAAGSVTTGSELDTVLALEGTPGADQIAALAPGDRLTIRWTLHPTTGSIDVMGTNTSLVFGGRLSSDVTGNGGPFWTERAPRTAIGARPDGTIVIVVVDGRQPGYSVGVTPRQLADFLISIGVEVAANLDGGGSSAVSVNGVLANRPSDGAGERSVGSALVIMPPGASPTYAPQSYSATGVDPATDPASSPEG